MALDCLHAAALTRDEWKLHTQDDRIILEPWLVPNGEHAELLHFDAGMRATHRVHIMGDSALVVDAETLETQHRWPRERVLMWSIDLGRMRSAIRSGLGMHALSQAASQPQVHTLGLLRGDGGESIKCVLVLAATSSEEHATISGLLSATAEPLLIMTPTGAAWSDSVMLAANQRGCKVCALSECLEVRGDQLVPSARWPDYAAELFARVRARMVIEPRDQSIYKLCKGGKMWSMTFAGQTFPLKDSVGLVYLREIVRHPHKARSFMDCMPRLGDKKARAGIAEAERRDPNFELKALKDARSGLTNDIENARRLGDMAAMDKAAGQLAQIKQQIRADTRLARTRQQQTAEHRSACNAFKQAMKRTIDEISEANSDAGRHFQDHLTVMQTVTYTPPPGVTWEF